MSHILVVFFNNQQKHKKQKMSQDEVKYANFSDTITMLRFPLAILVIFIHVYHSDMDVSKLHAIGFSGMAIYEYVRRFFSIVLGSSAVPTFFIISGYLLFLKVDNYSKDVFISKLGKRWHTLVIPYFLWIALYALEAILSQEVGSFIIHGRPWTNFIGLFRQNGWLHMLWDSRVWNERITWLGVETHESGPFLLPFWYMRDLMVMVLLSPVVYWLVKKYKIILICLLGAIYVFDIKLSWMSGTFACASLFFSLGSYLGINRIDFTQTLWKFRCVVFPLALILACLKTYGIDDRNILSPWLVIFQSFALIVLASVLCKFPRLFNFNNKMASTSFFIYSIHLFILGYVTIIVNKLMPVGDIWYINIVNYFILVTLIIGACLMVYWIMLKSVPEILRILVGDRKNKV